MKNIIITGGCGFIGRNLCKKLLASDDVKIRVIDNLSVEGYEIFDHYLVKNQLKVNWQDKLTVVQQDVRDYVGIYNLFEHATHVIHLAANTGVQPSILAPQDDCQTNVMGTLNCLRASVEHGVRKFVFASSGAPLGEQIPPLHENMNPRPVSPYGASKLAGEAYLNAFYHSFGLNSVALRFSNVYGPGSDAKNSVIAKFIKNVIKSQPIKVFGDGRQTRDFIYVDDLTNAILLSMEYDRNGSEIFQIATSCETSITELLSKLGRVFEQHNVKMLDVGYDAMPRGDVMRNFSKISKAFDLLHWQPEVDMEEGLIRTVKYYMEGEKFHV